MRGDYDVVVIGGGPGGSCAAVAAAKEGASVLLIERYGFLGGMATAALVNPFGSYSIQGRRFCSSVFGEILDRLDAAGTLTTDETLKDKEIFDAEALKVVLDRMMADYGVDLLLHSFFCGAHVVQGRIQHVDTWAKSGRLQLSGKVYVDGTGDGDLAAQAGAPFEVGRPEDGLCQPMSLYFRVGGLPPSASVPQLKGELIDIMREARSLGAINQPYDRVHLHRTLMPHVYAFQCTHIVKQSGLDVLELTAAELEARRQVHEMYALFKRAHPLFKDAYLLKTAAQVGIRETRRILGDALVEASDVTEARKFPDGIARSNYSIDIHNPEGPGIIGARVPHGDFYEIPYGALLPRDVENLLIGSRCVSATHEAHASLRVMPVVAGMGEAAGTAAAWSVQRGLTPREIHGAELKDRLLDSWE